MVAPLLPADRWQAFSIALTLRTANRVGLVLLPRTDGSDKALVDTGRVMNRAGCPGGLVFCLSEAQMDFVKAVVQSDAERALGPVD